MTINQIRTRNWQKARLTGFCLDHRVLSEGEKGLYEQMMVLRDSLLSTWDGQTELLIGHPLPPYKCCSCGRRVYRKLVDIEGELYCPKHYKAFFDDYKRINRKAERIPV